jgi:hypothetical protein
MVILVFIGIVVILGGAFRRDKGLVYIGSAIFVGSVVMVIASIPVAPL